MEATILRSAKESDLEALVDLCRQHAHYEQTDYDLTNKKELLAQHLFTEHPSLFCLVAEQQDRLIGYATFMKQFSTWDAAHYLYMDCLFLTEAVRGYGLGKQIIERIKQEALNLNCDHIQWQTPEFNIRAIQFYKRLGAVSKTKERFFLAL